MGRSSPSRSTSRALAVDTSGNPSAPRVQGTFNSVLVATMHNTLYLYDADRERPGPGGQNVPLWATWLGKPRPGEGSIDMFFTNDPEWGILGTPVVDAAKSVVYVVAWHDDGGGPQGYKYRLHALRLKDGTHLAPPVTIDAPGLNARHQKQRAGPRCWPAASSTSRSGATAAAGSWCRTTPPP